MEPPVELYQFRYSPYNEKVRWALALKRVPHRRISLLPGPHMRTVRAMSGQTATPVLRIGDEIVFGSARILDRLEALYPEPRLAPEDAAERERASAIERRFDEELTPRVRRAVLDAILTDVGYFARVFGGDRPAWQRLGYRLMLPLAKGLVRKGNGIAGPASIEDGIAAGDEALDMIARETRETGYLVGGRFSRADLAAAAHLASLIDPPHPDMERPRPWPARLEALITRYRGHPGAAWVLEIYRKHRPDTRQA